VGLRFLDDFLTLAETGNFSRAAEERNVTQPAFSRRIKALESYVGVALIDRRSYPATLTPAGVAFRDAALGIVGQLRHARVLAREAAGKDRDLIRIAALHSIATTYHPAWFAAITRETGDYTVQMTCDNLHNCVQLFLEGSVHWLVVFSHPAVPVFLTPTSFSYLVAERDRLIPVCAPAKSGKPRYPLPGQPGSPLPYLQYGANSYLGKVVDELLRPAANKAHLRLIYEDDLTAGLKAMAVAGHGLAWLPEKVVAAELKSGSLVICGDERWITGLEVRGYTKTGISEELRRALEHGATPAA
jgi:LysR family transcriptional regulator, hypochlorite-specific transcription factor HypT